MAPSTHSPPEVIASRAALAALDAHSRRTTVALGALCFLVVVLLLLMRVESLLVLLLLALSGGVAYTWSHTREFLQIQAARDVIREHEAGVEREGFGDFEKWRHADDAPTRVEKAREVVARFRIQLMSVGLLLLMVPFFHFFVDRFIAHTATLKMGISLVSLLFLAAIVGGWAILGGPKTARAWWRARALLTEWERFRLVSVARYEAAKRAQEDAQREAERARY